MASRRSAGTIKVLVAKAGQDVTALELRRGATLDEALVRAGFGSDTLVSMLEGVRVNGKSEKLDKKLADGDFVFVAPQVKGG